MKITLRKANALQEVILAAVNALSLRTDTQVNEFEDSEAKLVQETTRFTENLKVRGEMLDVIYEIRSSVARANQESGINDLLAKLARSEKDSVVYDRISREQPRLPAEVIAGKLAKIKARTEDIYGREDMVTTSILDAAQLQAAKTTLALLKKASAATKDQLLELNITTTIGISDKSEAVMRSMNLI